MYINSQRCVLMCIAIMDRSRRVNTKEAPTGNRYSINTVLSSFEVLYCEPLLGCFRLANTAKATMGIEIELWRARIGSFSQPIKCKTLLSVLRVKSVSLCIRILLFLLLVVNGVETNPGPGPNSGNAAAKGRIGSTSESSRGRGRGEPSESNQRLLRSNSSSAHGGAQGQAFRSASPTVLTYSSTPSAQPPVNQWFSSNSGAMSPGHGANPGLF